MYSVSVVSRDSPCDESRETQVAMLANTSAYGSSIETKAPECVPFKKFLSFLSVHPFGIGRLGRCSVRSHRSHVPICCASGMKKPDVSTSEPTRLVQHAPDPTQCDLSENVSHLDSSREHNSDNADPESLYVPPKRLRQSLPTTRERRWLSELGITRIDSRPARTRSESFLLHTWPMCVSQPLIDKAHHKAHQSDNNELSTLSPQDGSLASHVPKTVEQLFPPGNDASEEQNDIESDSEQSSAGKTIVAGLSHAALTHSSKLLSQRELSLGNIFDEQGSQNSKHQPKWRPSLTEEELKAILTWAYIVRVKVSKRVLGKRAVTRNRAKRRVTAAARVICPAHAERGREYVFSAEPSALLTPFPMLLQEVEAALRNLNCWKEVLSPAETRRPRYRKSA